MCTLPSESPERIKTQKYERKKNSSSKVLCVREWVSIWLKGGLYGNRKEKREWKWIRYHLISFVVERERANNIYYFCDWVTEIEIAEEFKSQ